MKRTQYYVGACLFCLLAGFVSIHFLNASGTAQDVAKSAEANSDSGLKVGSVTMWWGARDAVPAGWEICNGERPKTSGATLTGNKPNLVDRFPKGALSSRTTVADLSQGVGGSHNMPALRIAKIDGLKIAEDGAHSHSPLDGKVDGADEVDLANNDSSERIVAVEKKNGSKKPEGIEKEDTDAEGAHSHEISGFVGSEKGVDADGNDKTGANQPAYSELFFIIRVK